MWCFAGSLACLSWSPDGLALAVGMSDGVYHIIDAELGTVRLLFCNFFGTDQAVDTSKSLQSVLVYTTA